MDLGLRGRLATRNLGKLGGLRWDHVDRVREEGLECFGARRFRWIEEVIGAVRVPRSVVLCSQRQMGSRCWKCTRDGR